MVKITSLVVGGTLLGGLAVLGCQSNNSPDQQPNGQSNATAGGNGAFGENPAQPGEHSGERFNNSTPTTQPAQ